MLQFLERGQQIRHRSAPAVQSPDQHDVNLPPADGFQQSLPRFALRRTRANLADVDGDYPATAGSILPHGAALHGQRLLISSGYAGIKAGPKHFLRFPWLAKNVIRFRFLGSPLGGHLVSSPLSGRTRSFSARQNSSYYA